MAPLQVFPSFAFASRAHWCVFQCLELGPIAVDAVLKVIHPARENNVNLKDIKSIKELGGTLDETELVDSLVFEQKAANGPKSMEKAKIGFIQFCVSPPQDGHGQSGGGVGLRRNGQSSS